VIEQINDLSHRSKICFKSCPYRRIILDFADFWSACGVRSIVVEAAALGEPRPELIDDFVLVTLRTPSTYAERLHALIALLRIGPKGREAAGAAFAQLGTDGNALRLRAEIIHRLYGGSFGPVEVRALLKDLAASTSGDTVTGILYMLTEQMPLADIATVLDGLPPAAQGSRASRRNATTP
jgi:hypothetical protein